jgi:hypothetical protein
MAERFAVGEERVIMLGSTVTFYVWSVPHDISPDSWMGTDTWWSECVNPNERLFFTSHVSPDNVITARCLKPHTHTTCSIWEVTR